MMRGSPLVALVAYLCLIVQGEILLPPDMNLALLSGTTIKATATCGVNENGQPIGDLFCSLGGANSYSPWSNQYRTPKTSNRPAPETDATHSEPHKFGELRLAGTEQHYLERGQHCLICQGAQDHPAEKMIDGSQDWWQSPPLSRGMHFNEINITINLKQEFQVAYVWIQMANSPRPAVWALDRSSDNGKTWKPWQYFAETESQCEQYFGLDSLMPIMDDDSVICTKDFSKIVPIENGEIHVRLLEGRPNRLNFTHSDTLQEFTRATNVRLRLIKTKNLLGDLMDGYSGSDPTVTRRYYYAIKEIIMGGRCMCNGHAESCDVPDASRPDTLVCRCKHNTEGDTCDRCAAGFDQKPWRPSRQGEDFQCEPCNCFGHSSDCVYDAQIAEQKKSLDANGKLEGGGVCSNCQDNTQGINCHECVFGYYRPEGRALNATNVCEQCVCDPHMHSGDCDDVTAKCLCNERFVGADCDSCAHGYYEYPECKPCDCYLNGTVDEQCLPGDDGQCPCEEKYAGKLCDDCASSYFNMSAGCVDCVCNDVGSESTACNTTTGQCPCKSNFAGLECDTCAIGSFGYPTCDFCDCDAAGTEPSICDPESGQCLCKEGFAGDKCDQCNSTYYGYPDCKDCGCDGSGSSASECDSLNGQCPCFTNFTTRSCAKCTPGYFAFPACDACDCFVSGSAGITCDDGGQCYCKDNYIGEKCEQCKPQRYNFPLCEECNCDPNGVIADFAGCDTMPPGELCQCKSNVAGRICNECVPGTWNLKYQHSDGCVDCGCSEAGSVSRLNECDMVSGQCRCRQNVQGRDCAQCAPGYHSLNADDHFGCSTCECDVGGSVNDVCDAATGKCNCKARVGGDKCDQPLKMHFAPTPWHMTLEAENGRTPKGESVRYSTDDKEFPDFSSRGFAVFSTIQPKEQLTVRVPTGSVYRLLLHYVNPSSEPIKLNVTLAPVAGMPQSTDAVPQSYEMQLPSNLGAPKTMPLQAEGRQSPAALVLTNGDWIIHLDTEQRLYLDYVVLLPSDYFEANSLRSKVRQPCSANAASNETCVLLAYPVWPEGTQEATEFQNGINDEPLPVMSEDVIPADLQPMSHVQAPPQPQIKVQVPATEPGKKHLLVMEYYNGQPATGTLQITATPDDTPDTQHKGTIDVNQCKSSALCRESLIDGVQRVPVLLPSSADTDHYEVLMTTDPDTALDFAIKSLRAVPEDQWNADLLLPAVKCVRKNGRCVPEMYKAPENGIVMEAESNAAPNDTMTGEQLPFEVADADTLKVAVLQPDRPNIKMVAEVPKPDYYVLVLDYYNPNGGTIQLPVTAQSDERTPVAGNVTLKHCAKVSGCRAVVIKRDDQRKEFQTGQMFTVELLPAADQKQPIYIDKLTAVPYQSYSDSVLDSLPVDDSERFLQECADEHFKVDPNTASEFCKKKASSMTVDFNSGAVACACNTQGSANFDCSPFGGQCECNENIIGRKCDECKPGYYGFPNCKKCECGQGQICDSSTGQCHCPPYVVGQICDQCDPRAYGYDKLIGCQLCGCHEQGSQQMRCDPISGQCLCKENVGDRRCDSCLNGFFGFSNCYKCNCELPGSSKQICDKETAACICKENVEGQACESCQRGSFNLEESNPVGCSKCHCFGTTDQCVGTTMAVHSVMNMSDWSSPDHDEAAELTESDQGHTLRIKFDPAVDSGKVYVSAPEAYLGKQILSYGLYLSFTVASKSGAEGSTASMAADVRIVGRNLTLEHWAKERPVDPTVALPVRVRLEPMYWRTVEGALATRPQMMLVLSSVESLQLKVSYFESLSEATLTDVKLESSEPIEAVLVNPHTAQMEQCQCPAAYTGSSCEDCADGYYRVGSVGGSGSALGACVPCQCNAHSNKCDKVTGECSDCQHDTHGNHCELCETGFFGDATRGSQYDCSRCPCPEPTEANSFASNCSVSDDGRLQSCTCFEGHVGTSCDQCDLGYWGQPKVPGSKCEQCECNENNDLNVRANCDMQTGRCAGCTGNSAGDHCERCDTWWFGDAIDMKNCTECECDKCGSAFCDLISGTCTCKPGVTGDLCDECEENTWGLRQCQGCRSCQCQSASTSLQCNQTSGQCDCQPGVEGQYCERCAEGYWNYTDSGCIKCDCEADLSAGTVCDVQTGQCQCQPGATGARCDTCLPGYLVIPTKGCRQCDECVHVLREDLITMQLDIDNATSYIANVSHSALLGGTLAKYNTTAYEYTALTNALTDNADKDGIQALYDDASVNKDSANERLIKANRSLQSINDTKNKLDDFMLKAEDVGNNMTKQKENVQKAVDNVKQLAHRLTQGGAANERSRLIEEAKSVLEQLRNVTMEEAEQNAANQLESANQLLSELAENATDPVTDQTQKQKQLVERLQTVNDRLKAAAKKQDDNQKTIQLVKELVADIDKELIEQATKSANEKKQKANDNSEWAKEQTVQAQDTLQETGELPKELNDKIGTLNETVAKLEAQTDEVNEELPSLTLMPTDAKAKANELERSASAISAELSGARSQSEQAVSAASAYDKIQEEIGEAEMQADEAKTAAQQAVEQPSGVVNEANQRQLASMNLMREASAQRNRLSNNITNGLTQAEHDLDQVKDKLGDSRKTMTAAKTAVAEMINAQQSAELDRLDNFAASVEEKANAVDDYVKEMQPKLEKLSEASKGTVGDVSGGVLDLASARAQLQLLTDLIPNVTAQLEEAEALQMNKSKAMQAVDNKLLQLKAKIALARDTANRIKVGIETSARSSLRLVNPDTIEQSEAQTSFSLYFKTKQNDGLLFFFGNEVGSGKNLRALPTDDYLAAELREGKAVVVLDLGAGPHTLQSNEFVADGEWHSVKVDRVGRAVSLTVTSEAADGQANKQQVDTVIGGDRSVLDLNKAVSKIYVGGVPDSSRMPQTLKSRHFVGSIEEVALNGDPLGLWHHNGSEAVQGALERSQLTNNQASLGISLNGNGYIVLNRGSWNPRKRATIQLMFRSHARNGLMFYVGDKTDFLAIELSEGYVLVQFDLGSGRGQAVSDKLYNDGRWHRVRVTRKEKQITLKVDSDNEITGEAKGDKFELSLSDKYFVGGLPAYEISPLSAHGFVGCISQLRLGDVNGDSPVNLNNKVREAKGFEPGCPDTSVTVVSTVTQDQGLQPMVQFRNMTLPEDGTIEISLRFKTQADSAQLLYLSDADTQQWFSLQLHKGYLKLQTSIGTDGMPASVSLELTEANDARWHFVTVIRDSKKMRISADDVYKAEREHGQSYEQGSADAVLTFMTRPDDSDTDPLIGCLADATFNKQLMDFAAAAEVSKDVSMVGCPIADPVTDKDSALGQLADGKQRSINVTPSPIPQKQSAGRDQRCALNAVPIGPREDSVGWRFGVEPDSNWEIQSVPAAFDKQGTFSVQFRATAANGVVFFATNAQYTDHLALYLQNGKLVFSYNSGSGTASLVSAHSFMDAEWHTVLARREGRQGWLTVDGREEAQGQSPGTTDAIDATPPFYMGGIPAHLKPITNRMLPEMFPSYSGCLRAFQLNRISILPPIEQNDAAGVKSCGMYTEAGKYFAGNGSYAIVDNELNVGLSFSIELEMKPRVTSAVLLAIQGKDGDYLTLQLVDGKLIFSVNNGAGPETMTYEPNTNTQLCDGHWHQIKIYKAKSLMTLSVDGQSARPYLLKHRSSVETNTNDALYFGGVPVGYVNRGLRAPATGLPESFIGCVRTLKVGHQSSRRVRLRRSDQLSEMALFGDVRKQMCPVN